MFGETVFITHKPWRKCGNQLLLQSFVANSQPEPVSRLEAYLVSNGRTLTMHDFVQFLVMDYAIEIRRFF